MTRPSDGWRPARLPPAPPPAVNAWGVKPAAAALFAPQPSTPPRVLRPGDALPPPPPAVPAAIAAAAAAAPPAGEGRTGAAAATHRCGCSKAFATAEALAEHKAAVHEGATPRLRRPLLLSDLLVRFHAASLSAPLLLGRAASARKRMHDTTQILPSGCGGGGGAARGRRCRASPRLGRRRSCATPAPPPRIRCADDPN